MTYTGVMSNGVVVIEGSVPPDGTRVEVKPLTSDAKDAELPGFGIWKDRADMADSVHAARELRGCSERRNDHA